jgi:hypothetical protein
LLITIPHRTTNRRGSTRTGKAAGPGDAANSRLLWIHWWNSFLLCLECKAYDCTLLQGALLVSNLSERAVLPSVRRM